MMVKGDVDGVVVKKKKKVVNDKIMEIVINEKKNVKVNKNIL
jgi:hypothetical protein